MRVGGSRGTLTFDVEEAVGRATLGSSRELEWYAPRAAEGEPKPGVVLDEGCRVEEAVDIGREEREGALITNAAVGR